MSRKVDSAKMFASGARCLAHGTLAVACLVVMACGRGEQPPHSVAATPLSPHEANKQIGRAHV